MLARNRTLRTHQTKTPRVREAFDSALVVGDRGFEPRTSTV